MLSILKHRPITAYFVLTFLVSWSGVIAVSFFLGMPTTSARFAAIGPQALIPFLVGPTVVGLIMIGAVHGRAGFRRLVARLLRWRVAAGYYAFALFTAPLLLGLILLVLTRISADYLPMVVTDPDRNSLIVTGLLTGLIGGGLLEETGWTGFVTPEFRCRGYGILRTGLVLGFFWGLWHFLPVLWGSGDAAGRLDWPAFYPGLFTHYAVLIPYRILLVWLNERSGSLVPVMLMHASFTCFLLFIFRTAATGLPLLGYFALVALALWLIAALVLALEARRSAA